MRISLACAGLCLLSSPYSTRIRSSPRDTAGTPGGDLSNGYSSSRSSRGLCCGRRQTPPAAPRRMDVELHLSVNGTPRTSEIEPRTLLVHHLRDNLGLTGTKV